MNIAIFTNNYLPNPYGVSGSIESFRKELERRGHKVYVFAPEAKGYTDENLSVFRYPAVDLTFNKIRFPLPIPFSFKMDRILKDLEIDIIHAQHPNLLGWQAKRWAKKKKVPLVFTWHTLYDKYVHFFRFAPRPLAIWWTLKNAVGYANEADQVIVPTPSVKEIIVRWGVRNGHIAAVATGVDEDEFSDPNPERIRAACGISAEKKVLLIHSRLTEEKNVMLTVAAAAKVLFRNPDAVLVISGRGSLLEDIRSYIAKKGLEGQTFFVDGGGRQALKDIYAAADIFLYASKSETQGMVITEAMYMGLPVVAVAATGIRNLVANQISGLLTKDCADSLAAGAEKLLRDCKIRAAFSENAKKIARQHYTAFVCTEKLLQVYAQTSERKKGKNNS